MQRLFAGTPWDRPPVCERCGQPESECDCPPPVPVPKRAAPETQTAHLRLEKRGKGKLVTLVANLDPEANDLPELASQLKSRCGVGGTVKEGRIELQGDRRDAVEQALRELGYQVRRR